MTYFWPPSKIRKSKKTWSKNLQKIWKTRFLKTHFKRIFTALHKHHWNKIKTMSFHDSTVVIILNNKGSLKWEKITASSLLRTSTKTKFLGDSNTPFQWWWPTCLNRALRLQIRFFVKTKETPSLSNQSKSRWKS